MGARNNGAAKLLVHSPRVGYELRDNGLIIDGKAIRISKCTPKTSEEISNLEKTPYVDPAAEERRLKVAHALHGISNIRLQEVQLGVLYRPAGPRPDRKPGLRDREFSVEWGDSNVAAWMSFVSVHNTLRIAVRLSRLYFHDVILMVLFSSEIPAPIVTFIL
jgi:hypothetical protein